MWKYHKSAFLCTHQRLKIRIWKIKVLSVLSLTVNGEIHKDPNMTRRDFFFQTYVNPCSPEGFSQTYFPKGGVVATPPLDYQYWRSYNPKFTTSV